MIADRSRTEKCPPTVDSGGENPSIGIHPVKPPLEKAFSCCKVITS